MASIPSPAPLNFSDDNQKLELESVRELVFVINQHMNAILEDFEAQKALKLKCTSKLKIQSQEFFEFSEHSVLSNLYWGIDNTESAARATCTEDRAMRLESSEKMLQVPASLDENGVTLGIPNSFLVCCSYFYLCIVELLRKNEWQASMHFLQAVSVSPRLVCTELAPGIFQGLFALFIGDNVGKSFGSRRVNAVDDKAMVDDVMRWMARRYKPWLMYYQIMSKGDVFQGIRGDEKSQCVVNRVQRSRSIESQSSCEHRTGLRTYQNELMQLENTHRPKCQKDITNDVKEESLGTSTMMPENHRRTVAYSEKSCSRETRGSSNVKCLRDILTESDPDTPVSLHSDNRSSVDEDFPQNYAETTLISLRNGRVIAEDHQAEPLSLYGSLSWNTRAPSSKPKPERTISLQRQTEVDEKKVTECISRSFSTSFCDTDVSALGLRKTDQYAPVGDDDYIDEVEKLHCIGSTALKNYQLSRPHHQKSSKRIRKSSSCRTTLSEVHQQPEESFFVEQSGVLEKIISKLCFTEELGNGEEDYTVEMKTIYEILNSKSGLKYSLLKDIILDQLLKAISTSKEERVVRTSVAILSTIVTANRSVIEDIKRKGLQLYDLATALKRNIHEAVILIYLINPSPAEIKTLELLPCLVEVVCTSKSYKLELTSILLTPPAASLMIIEVLVTAFDYETNRMHLAAISSPRVLSGLLKVPRQENLEEFISLAAILVNCMRFDGKCRKYISEFSPVVPLVSLLCSNQERASSIALEFLNELQRMPRSSAIALFEQIHKQGSINNMCALFLLIQNSEPEYRLLAANLLLQLEVLEDTSAKCIYREEAAEALLESLTCEECPSTQALSAFILSNLGGTYSWTGESYTTAWLVKKTGLTLAYHGNLIKNYDFLDQSLQDAGIDSWCSKIAQRILHLGTSVFHALDKGLNSKLKRVSRDCLVATAWLGCELVKGPDELRHAACEIILHSIEQFLHPGLELEERLLACLCIYNYTSGRGMKKIINLSEGVRESLRRLSNVTWMAEELLKVADYFQPNKWRISCVHSQILEAGTKCSGAVTALIYYKGQLHSGYADGSIKVWDIKGQKAILVQETKEHKKAVTCFALYEPGNCLLSGSADKTIKMWQMLQRNLECIEVIPTKESIRSIDSWGELIFATTQNHKLKVIDASRKAKDVFKNKRVKCIRVAQGKVYAGCMDSSIQELMIINNRQQEIKAPSKSWMQNKPITSVSIYKDWLYSASSVLEGSKMKDWRRSSKPQISTVPEKGASILAMEVVEDFIYLNCSTSTSSLQIWLRGTQHKVGRLSAGSKITSLLSANDMILCGTERGVIKGWIPL
ncbi:putative E3 ubiquitin-protein ligase LIN [Sesamum alatum]|uniref:E3 ubiquitin-protein ligase LIN n=1 Tax=Sesamum alatum TaxID=300844 RepID=A0AAE2CKV6_9LAMI|nr:putative E3 ubiquitin-protein ligase LIN [Sesamum alatum]